VPPAVGRETISWFFSGGKSGLDSLSPAAEQKLQEGGGLPTCKGGEKQVEPSTGAGNLHVIKTKKDLCFGGEPVDGCKTGKRPHFGSEWAEAKAGKVSIRGRDFFQGPPRKREKN